MHRLGALTAACGFLAGIVCSPVGPVLAAEVNFTSTQLRPADEADPVRDVTASRTTAANPGSFLLQLMGDTAPTMPHRLEPVRLIARASDLEVIQQGD